MRVKRYDLDKIKDELGNPVILTDGELVQLINIRYTMSLVAYKKYETTTITSYVDEETVADIMEHTSELQGVDIEESTIRRYNDSIYFAPIIGYTGKVQEDQLEELKKENTEYELSDIVGRTGIEYSMETELQGLGDMVLSLIHILIVFRKNTIKISHIHVQQRIESEGTAVKKIQQNACQQPVPHSRFLSMDKAKGKGQNQQQVRRGRQKRKQREHTILYGKGQNHQ